MRRAAHQRSRKTPVSYRNSPPAARGRRFGGAGLRRGRRRHRKERRRHPPRDRLGGADPAGVRPPRRPPRGLGSATAPLRPSRGTAGAAPGSARAPRSGDRRGPSAAEPRSSTLRPGPGGGRRPGGRYSPRRPRSALRAERRGAGRAAGRALLSRAPPAPAPPRPPRAPPPGGRRRSPLLRSAPSRPVPFPPRGGAGGGAGPRPSSPPPLGAGSAEGWAGPRRAARCSARLRSAPLGSAAQPGEERERGEGRDRRAQPRRPPPGPRPAARPARPHRRPREDGRLAELRGQPDVRWLLPGGRHCGLLRRQVRLGSHGRRHLPEHHGEGGSGAGAGKGEPA